MWMNQHEVEYALNRCQNAPNLPAHVLKAARFLNDFCHLINDISDGWAYWSYGTKCSDSLQELVNEAQWPINQYPSTASTNTECVKACNKVKNFLKRCKQTKDNPTVQDFLRNN